MTTLLKKLTQLKTSNNLNGEQVIEEDAPKEVGESLSPFKQGYGMSKKCGGNSHNLKSSLEKTYETFERKCKEDVAEQEKLKHGYITEQKGKKTALLNTEEKLKNLHDKVDETTEEIEVLNKDCRKVLIEPEVYLPNVDKKASVKFWIGLFFLMPLAAYIFIFYISTSFSAFFREFDPEVSLFQGMFDPQALSKAYEAGGLELGFVLFIPFVFFGLGYLIHMFQEKKGLKNGLKIAALFLITFVFDAILAYLIDEKLYNLTKTFDSEEFNFGIAFTRVNFWLIIFAGFVSYIVWGLVFDFVMKEYADRDKIKIFIKEKQGEIKEKEQKVTNLKELVTSQKEVISAIKIRISELQNIIDGFILPVMNYKALSTGLLEGWQGYISAELPLGKEEKEALLIDCRKVYDKHIQDLEINTDTYQNKIYTKKL
ncbi:MAG: beta-carotene 15,15'-monooxygenase [Flavobacteriaceae bacterium]